ncbi:MAG: hypothetical protein KDD62_10960, partial [Bdellovibrionales bacterium]|nr:hypothetical protein [Bdellovibrionales bacterium]
MSLNQQPEPNKNQGQEKKEQESFIPPDLDTELDPEFKAMLDDMLDKPVRTSAKIIIQDIRDSLSNAAQAIGPYAQAARDETLRTGREVTNALINAGKSFWQSSQDIANATAKTTSDAVLSLPKHVVTLMELVGADPEEDRGFFSELGKSLP